MASASARTGTHAPLFIKRSAVVVWLGSSRVMMRSRMLVSTARMLLPDVIRDPLFQCLQGFSFRWSVGKYRPMNVLGGEPACAAHYNLIALFVPLQNRTGTDAKLFSNAGWDRNLPLRCYLR